MPERAASAGRQGVLYSLPGSAMLSSIDPASNYSFQALTCSDLTSSARDSRVGRAGMRCDGRGCAQCTACKTRDAGSWRYERGARLLACLPACGGVRLQLPWTYVVLGPHAANTSTGPSTSTLSHTASHARTGPDRTRNRLGDQSRGGAAAAGRGSCLLALLFAVSPENQRTVPC